MLDRGEIKTEKRGSRRFESWQVAGLVLLVAIAGLLGFAFWPSGEDEALARETVETEAQVAEIEATILSPIDFPIRVEATGHLQAWRRAEVSAEASGLVIKRLVEEGDRVDEGDILFELDGRDAAMELAEAEAEWIKLQAEYAVRFREEIETSPVDSSALKLAEENLLNAEEAYKNGSITVGELESVKRSFERERIQSPGIRRSIQAANIGLTQAEQRKARAELALARTHILAPYSGHVADILVEEGQHVNSGQSVLTLLDDNRMKVDVDVLEADMVRIREGATARVRVPSLENDIFSGTVYSVNPSINPATGAGRVTIAISNQGGALIAGLFTYAYLEVNRLQQRLVLPSDAILVRQGRDLVFRIEGGRAMWVYVEVGARSGDFVEINEGLSQGDTIAVAGHFALAHDVPVLVSRFQAGLSEGE